MTDVVTLHRRACALFADRVRGVHDDQWGLPTPCTEWDVRALVNHVTSEDRWTVPLLQGATIADVGDRFDGDLLGDRPVTACLEAVQEAQEAAAAPGVLDRTVHLSFGDVPASEYLSQLFADHLIHGWDLARAVGGEERLDPELVEACAAWFDANEATYRSGGAIGPPVPISADADAQTRLLSRFGRSVA